MDDVIHNPRIVVTPTPNGPEIRVDGQRRVTAKREVILRIPLGRHAAHKLAILLLQSCVPEEEGEHG